MRASRPNGGFALVAAIGVLAVLMIFAISAASTARFTLGFSHARMADRRLGSALDEGVALLAAGKSGLLKPAAAGSAPTSVALIGARSGLNNDVVVSATVGLQPDPALLPSALVAREGDLIVRLDAARADGRGPRRTALVLMNSAGQRRAPILLQETRP